MAINRPVSFMGSLPKKELWRDRSYQSARNVFFALSSGLTSRERTVGSQNRAELSDAKSVTRFPTWLCGITLALTFATFALVVWAGYGKYRAAENFRNRESRIRTLHGAILRLDEVLTMSARMAAATGDRRWEQRYRRYEPKLDAAIAEAEALVPGGSSIASVAGTDAANVKLVAMENSAFALVRAGRLDEAHAVLSSPAYEAQKLLYGTGLDRVLREQQVRLDETLVQAKQRATLSLAVSAALLLFSMATWIVIISRLRGMQRELERRIAERTAALSATTFDLLALGRRNALILSSVTDGIVGLDSEGRPTFLNPAAERMLGKALHDFNGATLHVAAEDVFWRADGSSFPVEYSLTPTHDAEGGTTSVMTFRDVTERRETDRLKDEFVSTVSHELRTPLTAIRGALGLLKGGMLGDISGKGQRMLEIATSNTDRLVRLINDILDVERFESGKTDLKWGAATANELMTEASESLQGIADHAAVSIVVEPIDVSLWVDRDRMVQTLINVLSNAIKFSPRGTTVTIGGSAGELAFTFRVADQGRGVPADKGESIFERFRQVDASDSRDKGGSGLGLTICRSIIKAHGGRIWVESDGVSGSVFQFTVPLAAVTAPA
jgi:signal transduction histidine kinase